MRLLRFDSTQCSEELTSFAESVERIKSEQKGIYWICGETQDAIVMSAMLEYFEQKGINEYYGQQPKGYSDHELLCITKENCEIAKTDEEKKGFGDLKTQFESICNKITHILGTGCKKIVTSKRLVVTPCARFMIARALGDSSMSLSMQAKILEVNATHLAITRITNQLDADDKRKTARTCFRCCGTWPSNRPVSHCPTPPHSA
jgi:molecular chaperone HtpG